MPAFTRPVSATRLLPSPRPHSVESVQEAEDSTMDPATLAIAAATLIATKAAEGTGSALSDAMRDGLTRLHQAVRARFSGDTDVTESIRRVEAEPESKALTAELARALRTRLATDPETAAQLEKLVNDIPQGGGAGPSFVTTVKDNAEVGKIANIGEVKGDVSF
ncbi:hypothetical protein [Actinoplanes sp. GCM10030250]|uniref:hypothetical protein n=1 Tax=Actinoplanes sp. GCM10030250 TaxID=3273376 RepID=UPI0036126D87